MSRNFGNAKKKIQICLHCKKQDKKEKYYEIFDRVGVQLKLNTLLLKYFKLKVVKAKTKKGQVICEQCLDELTNALDEDEYNKQQKQAAAEAKKKIALDQIEKNKERKNAAAAEVKKRSPTKRKSNTIKEVVVLAQSPKTQIIDIKKIPKTPKKAKPLKEEKTVEKTEVEEDYIKEILENVLTNTSIETSVVEQTECNEDVSLCSVSEDGNVDNVAHGFDDDDNDNEKVIVEGTEILFDDIEKYRTEDETISLKTQNGIEFVISDGHDDDGVDDVNGDDETYEDYERIEDSPSDEAYQDPIDLCTLIPFSTEDDDQIVDVTSFLDEAIKSVFTTFKFAWFTKCHICSWNCETFESLVEHVYEKHNLKNKFYACPIKDCGEKLEGKQLLTRHLILNHGPLNELSIYGSCPDCGITFSNFTVFNRHSCARMIKRRRGMRLHCKLCEIDFSSMKRYVFHMQFHLENHRPKVCLICNYKSNDIEELFEHVNYDHELQDGYPCRICDRSFKEKQNLLDHKHPNNNQFVCKVCNRSYHFKTSLMAHIKSAHSPVLQCDLCKKDFASEANYRYHQKSHLNASTALHACSNCGFISSDRDRILDHVNTIDSDCFGVKVEDEVVSVAYTCEFCLFDFKSKCDLKLHRSTGVHSDGQFFCVPCNKVFTSIKQYRSHSKHVTSKWQRENIYYLFMCNVDDCEESYIRWNSLYTHKRRHHNVIKNDDMDFEEEPEEETEKGTKSFVCQFCDKSCPTKMSLSVHIARRHNNKNVVCSVCKASFKNEHALKKHFEYLHVKIQCSKCLKMVKNRRNYDVHERVVHLNEKRYFCSFCSKGFYHKGDKEAHVKLHEQSYSCEQCEFTTSYAKSLEIHFASSHRHEFDYVCELCNQKFARKSALALHTAKHCKLNPALYEKAKSLSKLDLRNRYLKYKHDADDDEDHNQSKPSNHKVEPTITKRSKRLQMKDKKNYTITDNTDNDDDDDGDDNENDAKRRKNDKVASKNKHEAQQYDQFDNDIDKLMEEIFQKDNEIKKEKTRRNIKKEKV